MNPPPSSAVLAQSVAMPPRPVRALGSLTTGPVAGPLLRLAMPTILVLVVQTLVGVAEIYFVGKLGLDALAGMSLVFPVFMLMAMMSNGGIGGGVSSAVARAMGGGRQADADALVLHGVVLAVLFGLAFSAAVLGGGDALFRALGGTDGAVRAAVRYGTFVFGGAVIIWIVNLLASALRGAGSVRVPALVTLSGAVIVVPLSPALIFGLGPLPRLGIEGAGVAILVYYALAAVALVAFLRSARSPIRLGRAQLEWRLFKDVLGVGALSAFGTVQSNLTVAIFTTLAGGFGTAALAGYGLGARLDYLLIPLLFGLGTATVTMVGANVGAGNIDRARRVAWVAAAIGIAMTETIGLAAALFPSAWLGLFTQDAGAIEIGARYLRIVAPFYGLTGLGMMLYFASQGAKRVLWPVLAGTLRLAIAVGGGWLAVDRFGTDIEVLFAMAAASSIGFGAMVAISTALSSWRPDRP